MDKQATRTMKKGNVKVTQYEYTRIGNNGEVKRFFWLVTAMMKEGK